MLAVILLLLALLGIAWLLMQRCRDGALREISVMAFRGEQTARAKQSAESTTHSMVDCQHVGTWNRSCPMQGGAGRVASRAAWWGYSTKLSDGRERSVARA